MKSGVKSTSPSSAAKAAWQIHADGLMGNCLGWRKSDEDLRDLFRADGFEAPEHKHHCNSDTRPAEPIAVAIVEGRFAAGAGRGKGDFPIRKARIVFAALRGLEELPHPALGIDPAGDAVVAAAEQGAAIFHRAQGGAGEVLPLRRALTEPAVVGQVHEQIGVDVDVVADVMRERVFKADQRGELVAG